MAAWPWRNAGCASGLGTERAGAACPQPAERVAGRQRWLARSDVLVRTQSTHCSLGPGRSHPATRSCSPTSATSSTLANWCGCGTRCTCHPGSARRGSRSSTPRAHQPERMPLAPRTASPAHRSGLQRRLAVVSGGSDERLTSACRYSVVRTGLYTRNRNEPGVVAFAMSTVTVREFSYNPSAIFARAEQGETIEITRHGKIIATLIPGQRKPLSRLELLEATGALRRSGKTTDDLDSFTQIDVGDDVDPMQALLADRHDTPDWEHRLGAAQ